MSNTFGEHLRSWRRRRRLTQMELAFRVEVSPRHLGFVELGRASPSRALVLRLAEELDVPLRERNVWLIACGLAPIFPDRPLADPTLAAVRSAIDLTLAAHRPFPAFALDRHWNVVASNGAVPELYDSVDDSLLAPPVNVLRLCLHPRGLAPRIRNLAEWTHHLLRRLDREFELTADPALSALQEEAKQYRRQMSRPPSAGQAPQIAIPLRIATSLGDLAFFSTVSVFGTAVDVTLSEIALELFYPADEATRQAVMRASCNEAGARAEELVGGERLELPTSSV
ncbi:helix-turn-helix domain-containing protein [Rhodoligotrophos defluvii]|uniref:MmyB family transcriptional regulator n=1 Tax=Rhodoligotrophos defluvii TaxID=2561934 RepID=UPI0010C94DE5|nr:helix-turn-helix domain-containing protein [Rhodoligotrophos defluvii]